jgi:hypothetical protein
MDGASAYAYVPYKHSQPCYEHQAPDAGTCFTFMYVRLCGVHETCCHLCFLVNLRYLLSNALRLCLQVYGRIGSAGCTAGRTLHATSFCVQFSHSL